MDMKRFFLYAIVIAALTLAGCGGGGGGTTAMPVDPTPPDPTAMVTCPDGTMAASMDACPSGPTPEEMALEAAQDAAMAAYMAAKMALYGAVDTVAMQTAQKYADMAKEANDAAQAATASAMAEEYQMAAETARDQAQEAAMMRGLGITILANKITNQSAIDNAVLEGRDPPKPVSNAGRVGTALQASAQGEVTPTSTDETQTGEMGAGGAIQGSSATSTDNLGTATVTYNASGPMFTVYLPATPRADAVTRGETPTSLMTRGGWMGAELVGENEDGTSTTYANVYTDIQAPVVKDTYEAADATATHTADELGEQLANDPEVTGDVPNDGSSFTAMYNENSGDNAPPVPGMFSCLDGLADGCAISVKDGVVESIQGYIFQPRVSIGTNRVVDADYLAWGVWLRVPDAVPTDATETTFAGAFARGMDVFAVYPELKGKATYNGVANGLYSAGGMVEQFDADVMLEANFGGTEGGDSTPRSAAAATGNDSLLLGVVTGMVSNINAGGMAVDGSLMLGRATVTRANDTTETTQGGFAGDTTGTLAGRDMTGEWGGQFFGPNDATTDMARESEFPTTAAGTFGASAPGTSTDPVRILGAFGSWKAE